MSGSVAVPRVVLAMRADGGLEVLADRPCRVFLTGGLLRDAAAELPPPRVGWAVVTAAIERPEAFETIARVYEGLPCDVEPS